MKLVFVHGLGGEEGGPLEQSLEAETRRAEHEMLTVRWPSGALQSIAGASLWEIAKDAVVEQNPWRLAVGVLVGIQREGHQRWDTALAHATHASQRLMTVVKLLVRNKEPFSVVGFSLGGRIVMSALQSLGDPGRCLRRAVFVAAAVSGLSFARLPSSLLSEKRVVNVYSESDEVLTTMYPFVHGLAGAAGASAVNVRGVRNVKCQAGHLSYANLAHRIVSLATE